MRGKKNRITAAAALAVLLLALLLTGCGGNKSQLSRQLDLGQKYLTELDFEQAVLAFEKAIELEPKCAQAYIGLAEAYAAAGQPEKALEVLSSAPADMDDPDALAGKLREIQALLSAQETEEESSPSEEETFPSEEETAEETGAEEESDGAQLDGHGQIPFEQRYAYWDFDSLPEGRQSFVESCAQAVMAKDKDAMEACMDNKDEWSYAEIWEDDSRSSVNVNLLTRWNEYKVRIEMWQETLNDGTMSTSLEVEFRSENGMGYYGWHDVSIGSYGESSPTEFVDVDSEFGECPCSGWQWNGTAALTGTWQSTEKNYAGVIDVSYEDSTETGILVDGLRQGEFIKTTRYHGSTTIVDADGSDTEEWEPGETTETTNFVDGLGESSNGYFMCGGISATHSMIEDKSEDNIQWFKESVYW